MKTIFYQTEASPKIAEKLFNNGFKELYNAVSDISKKLHIIFNTANRTFWIVDEHILKQSEDVIKEAYNEILTKTSYKDLEKLSLT